jgi:hypothetical protein
MSHKKPPSVFEVVFEKPGITPWEIPWGTLSRALSAIHRLAIGRELSEDEEELEPDEQQSMRLLGLKRGSAVFSFAGGSPSHAIAFLREAGAVVENPERLGDKTYLLNPIERLSTTARAMDCFIVIREPDDRIGVLARIGPDSYKGIAETVFLSGETALTGKVERVGGAVQNKCGLRVPFQNRMLFCNVASAEVARKLGQHLYQDVVVQGTARWIKSSWRIVGFTVNDVYQPSPGSFVEAFSALREAGGKGWDRIDDPEAFLQEIRG